MRKVYFFFPFLRLRDGRPSPIGRTTTLRPRPLHGRSGQGRYRREMPHQNANGKDRVCMNQTIL